MVLMNHGLFTFGDDDRAGLRPAHRAGRARRRASSTRRRHRTHAPSPRRRGRSTHGELAELRRRISDAAGHPMIVSRAHRRRDDGASSPGPTSPTSPTRGPATPDHVIRTKRVPLVGARRRTATPRDYEAYFDAQPRDRRGDRPLTMLDPAPRVVLDPELGHADRRPRGSATPPSPRDIYRHTIDDHRARRGARRLPRRLPSGDLFDVEYWELEQAKLRRAGAPAAAHRRGRARHRRRVRASAGPAREALLGRGCRGHRPRPDPAVADVHGAADFLGVAGDVTDAGRGRGGARRAGVERLRRARHRWCVNAGMFPAARRIAGARRRRRGDARDGGQRSTRRLALFALAAPAAAARAGGGRVVVIGVEERARARARARRRTRRRRRRSPSSRGSRRWSGRADGIRVNMVHPDAVFDTGAVDDGAARRTRRALRPDRRGVQAAQPAAAPRSRSADVGRPGRGALLGRRSRAPPARRSPSTAATNA